MADEYVMKEKSGKHLVDKIKSLLNLKQDKITFSGNSDEYLNGSGSFSKPAGGLTYGTFTQSSDGLVPAPGSSSTTKYLRADGTWQVPPDTNTTYGVFSNTSNGLVPSSSGRTASSGVVLTFLGVNGWETHDLSIPVLSPYYDSLVPASGVGTAVKILTSNGWVSQESITSSSDPLDAWPVGAVYISDTPTSPASLFGGTWTQMGSSTARYYLSICHPNNTLHYGSGYQSHSHSLSSGYACYQQDTAESGREVYRWKTSDSWVSNYKLTNAGSAATTGSTTFTSGMELGGSTGYTETYPNYQDAYMWRRTA